MLTAGCLLLDIGAVINLLDSLFEIVFINPLIAKLDSLVVVLLIFYGHTHECVSAADDDNDR